MTLSEKEIMENEERKNSIVTYCDWIPALKKLPPEDAGILWIALMEYAATGKEPDFSGNLALDVLFTQYAILINKDLEKYNETKKRRKAAAEERERKKREEAERTTKSRIVQNVQNCAETAGDSTKTTTSTVNVNVKGNVNDNVNGNVNGNVNVNNNINNNTLSHPQAAAFTPPSVEDVSVYCQSKGFIFDPEEFIDFYAGKGWMVGQNKMVDWKSTANNFERKKRKDLEKQQGARRNKKTIMQEMEDW